MFAKILHTFLLLLLQYSNKYMKSLVTILFVFSKYMYTRTTFLTTRHLRHYIKRLEQNPLLLSDEFDSLTK